MKCVCAFREFKNEIHIGNNFIKRDFPFGFSVLSFVCQVLHNDWVDQWVDDDE